MQATINYLTCKAQVKMPFSDAEKTFLVELYETFWWGGHAKVMPEAAKLANHYVNGKGNTVSMDSKPYEKSVVVQNTMQAMKAYVKDLASRNEYFFTLKGDKFTDLPFDNGKVLLLSDGLSEYMDSGLGIAKPFNYSATWSERWK